MKQNFVDSFVVPKLKQLPNQTPELIQLTKSFQELEQKSPGMSLAVLQALRLE
jgi:hypothetical protein